MGCNGSKRSPVSPGHDTNEQEDLSVAGPAREESQHPAFKLEKVSFAEEDGLQFDEDHPGYLELRQILDDPIGQKYLGTFMRQMHQHEALFCWLDIHEYVSIPTRDYRRCMAKHIYEKYVKDEAIMALGFMNSEMQVDIQRRIDGCRNDISLIEKDMFNPISKKCFLDIFQNTWPRFQKSELMSECRNELKDTYNHVTVHDFEYLGLLGQGGFGRVCHVRKRSTGRECAMKIQLKVGLVKEFHGIVEELNTERNVFESCNHPFIVDLLYALQTPAHAILVLDLVRCGDLEDALRSSTDHRMDEDRVRIYVAEIALALKHLHDLNTIYRDLKPSNVLLCEDGHIKMADMGLAKHIEVDHEVTPPSRPSQRHAASDLAAISESASEATSAESPVPPTDTETAQLPPTASPGQALVGLKDLTDNPEPNKNCRGKRTSVMMVRSKSIPVSSTDSTHSEGSPGQSLFDERQQQAQAATNPINRQDSDLRLRAKSVCGTRGYMAPELLANKGIQRRKREGYTAAVDWWALGVTMFELVVGMKPFAGGCGHGMYGGLIANDAMMNLMTDNERAQTEITMMQKGVRFSGITWLSEPCKDLIRKLLDPDQRKRMCCTPEGIDLMKQHPYFNGLDWDKLYLKQVEVSYVPEAPKIEAHPKSKYPTYTKMMAAFEKQKKAYTGRFDWYEEPDDKQKALFENWDYLSALSMRQELGILKHAADPRFLADAGGRIEA